MPDKEQENCFQDEEDSKSFKSPSSNKVYTL